VPVRRLNLKRGWSLGGVPMRTLALERGGLRDSTSIEEGNEGFHID